MRRRLFKNLVTAPCTEAVSEPTDEFEAAGEELQGAISRRLGRSLAIREVDAGSGDGCGNRNHQAPDPFFAIERLSIRLLAPPRPAHGVLVPGPGALHT